MRFVFSIHRSWGICAVVALLCMSSAPFAHAFGLFDTEDLTGGARWDAASRTYDGYERSLDGGIRFSLQGGSYEAFRDMFSWNTVPTVRKFKIAVREAFSVWTMRDPITGLPTQVRFVEDLGTRVDKRVTNGGTVALGAEIDLFAAKKTDYWRSGSTAIKGYTNTRTRNAFGDITLTSGTTNYDGHAITGADIFLNGNGGVPWTLGWFKLILAHQIGVGLGLINVEYAGANGIFIDDNFDEDRIATLMNAFAQLVDTDDPSASPLNVFEVDPDLFDEPGVNILMEGGLDTELHSRPPFLNRDDYAGRQFLYPFAGGTALTSGTGTGVRGVTILSSGSGGGGGLFASAIPEPTTSVLLLSGAVALLGKRRQAV